MAEITSIHIEVKVSWRLKVCLNTLILAARMGIISEDRANTMLVAFARRSWALKARVR